MKNQTYKKIGGKVIANISTHKAVIQGKEIVIVQKGFEIEGFCYDDEEICRFPIEKEDNILPMFEQLEEDNRVNVAAAAIEFNK